MKRELLYCILPLLLSSCAFSSTPMDKAGLSSFVRVLPSAVSQQRISEDCVTSLIGTYPPGHTSFAVVLPPEKGNGKTGESFSSKLENALRQRGFEITPAAPIKLGWTFDTLSQPAEREQEQQWYLTLSLVGEKESHTLSRVYTSSGTPVAGFAAGAR